MVDQRGLDAGSVRSRAPSELWRLLLGPDRRQGAANFPAVQREGHPSWGMVEAADREPHPLEPRAPPPRRYRLRGDRPALSALLPPALPAAAPRHGPGSGGGGVVVLAGAHALPRPVRRQRRPVPRGAGGRVRPLLAPAVP